MNWKTRLFLNTISREASYRWNIILGFILIFIRLLVTLPIWNQVLGNETIVNYNRSSMSTYLILAAFIATPFSFSHVNIVSLHIKTGELSTFLLKPINYLTYNFIWLVAQRLVYFIPISIFAVILSILFNIDLDISISLEGIILLVLNFVLLYFFGIFLSIFGFWLIETWPLNLLFSSLTLVFGGLAFPLDLLPNAIKEVIKLTPFPFFGYYNVKAIQGSILKINYFELYFISFSYILLTYFLCKIFWVLGRKKYESIGL